MEKDYSIETQLRRVSEAKGRPLTEKEITTQTKLVMEYEKSVKALADLEAKEAEEATREAEKVALKDELAKLQAELAKRMASHDSKAEAEFGSKNVIFTKEEHDEIMARHATNPAFQWLDRSSDSYWAFATRVLYYVPESIGRVQNSNRFVRIAQNTFILVAWFVTILPLYVIIGLVVQLIIFSIALIWLFFARCRRVSK